MRRALCLGAAIVLLALPALARQTPSRHLAATGVNAFCPDGCTADGCITDGTTAGLRCQKCQGNLIVDKASGRCACPAGKYTNRNVTSCIDCTKGSYCVGGIYNLSNLPDKVACPDSMTTLGLRSISQRACVNLPGFSYAVTADGVSSATVCPVDTYSPGLKKQRGCVPCPTGMTTNGLTGRNTPTACVVPAGYYLKAPGQVAPCPRGEWKSGINTNASCTKCALGVTTPTEGSASQAACNMVLPGYFAAYIVAGTRTVNKTGICPQKFYCPGGTPSAMFNPEDPTALSPSEATIKACPNGMWTQEMGSTTAEQCLTPPGYYTANGLTRQCASASYRADWKAAGQATECIVCGVGLLADMTDQLLVFRANGSTFQLPVQTSADDCYIQPGQGLYFQTNTNSWRAKNCDSNVYGVSNKTYGLTPSACRSCPEGMVAVNNNATFPRSTSFFVDNGDGTGGFFSPKACVTKGGYGYNGRIAQPCDQGSYNPQDTWSDCKACPFGTTTAGVGMAAAVVQCSAQIGYGFVSGAVRPCAIGTYNDAINPNTSAPCTSCPTGTTTSKEGGASTADCNRCAAGYGGPSCSTVCGGVAEGATYGPAGRAYGSDCLTCSSVGATIGYSFQWQLGNDLFVPRAVSPDAASKSTDCLSEYAQYVDGQYYIPIFPSNTNAQQPNLNNPLDDSGASNGTRTKSAATFQACVDECSANLMCEMVTYDYQEKSCTLRVAEVIDIVGAPYIAFKALPSGYTASSAWSLRQKAKQESEAGAKASTSGRYVFWQDWNALEVGTQTAAAGRSSFTGVQDCLNACDDNAECAAVTMQLTVAQTDAPKTCQLVKGTTQPGVFKRTVTRVDLTRLDLPGSYVFLCPSGFAANAGGGCTPITSTQRAALVLTAQGEACNDATKAAILASVKTYLSDPANAPGLYVPSLVIEVDCLEAAARRRQLLAGGGWKTLIFTLNLRFQGSAEAAPAVMSVVEADPCKVPGMCGGGRFNVTSGSGDASIDVTKAASLSFELASGLSNGHDTPLFLNATVTQSGKVARIPVVITGSGVTCRRAQLGSTIFACEVKTSVDTLLLNALAINPGGSAPLTATVNLSTVCGVGTVFDVDHCADIDACAFWPCGNGTVEASCADIPLGANSTEGRTCSCSDGYGYKSEAQGCQDLNACELAPCSAAGLATTCEDLPAPAPGNATGRTCGCNATADVYSEEGGCVELNACTFWPCANGTAPATCNDTLGGANSTEGRTCSCPAGFNYKDETDGCTELDACLYFACAANDLANATCADKVGGANSTAGRTCTCDAGWNYKDEVDGCVNSLTKFCTAYSTGADKEQMLIWQSSGDGSCVFDLGSHGLYQGVLRPDGGGTYPPSSMWLWTADPAITGVVQWCLLYSTDSNGLRSMLVPAAVGGSSDCATVAAATSGTWAVSAGGYTGGAVWTGALGGVALNGLASHYTYVDFPYCLWYALDAGVERFLLTASAFGGTCPFGNGTNYNSPGAQASWQSWSGPPGGAAYIVYLYP